MEDFLLEYIKSLKQNYMTEMKRAIYVLKECPQSKKQIVITLTESGSKLTI